MTKTGTGGVGGNKSADKLPKAGRKNVKAKGGTGSSSSSSKLPKGSHKASASNSHSHSHSKSSGGGGGGGSNAKSHNISNTNANNSSSTSQSRSYPRGVGLDFRKLAGLTLVSYIDHHGVVVRPEAPPSELAVAVARHFEQMDVDEEDCIGGFLERLEAGPSVNTDYTRKTQYYPSGHENVLATGKKGGGGGMTAAATKGTKKIIKKGKDGKTVIITSSQSPPAVANTIHTHPHRKRTKWAARPGEQVAAKVTRTDENGSWILASVQRFYPDTETYDVQDEDDTSKLIRLPWSNVMRLSTGSEGCFNKGSPECMAIFPETTSFYKAKVAKAPVWKLDHGVPTVKEIIVKFDDDEDGSGKTPHRRVPSRYVIPVPSTYFYDEQDDVDLIPPNSNGSAGVGGGRNNTHHPTGAVPTSLIPSNSSSSPTPSNAVAAGK